MQLRKTEAGQAAMAVVLAMSIFLIGAVGLAIDGSHLYAERQMAQAAADAAAQAGIRSIFNGSNADNVYSSSSNPTGTGFSASGTATTCVTSDPRIPCYYAQTLNGFNGTGDTVTYDSPGAATVGVPSSTLSSTDPVNLLRVTVSRQVPTTLFKFISSWTPSVTASATAAIVSVQSPVPIIVTHPWLAQPLSVNGTGSTDKVDINGGPSLSIQINSSNASTVSLSGQPIVNLSNAGPLNSSGNPTGGSLGSFGGPTPPSYPKSTCTTGCDLELGTNGQYVQPSYPILDPLSGVSAPSVPATAPVPTTLANGVNGCPASPAKSCMLYYPGLYTNATSINVSNQTAVFSPGIYYMGYATGDTVGASFTTAANGYMTMATGLTDSATGWTGNMLVYMTGPSVTSIGKGKSACTPPAGFADVVGSLSIGANGNVSLTGSPISSSYKNILFFIDHNASTASAQASLGGGGGLTLIGTIYATDTVTQMGSTSAATCGQYQSLSLSGGSGSGTNITGEIIASTLSMGGTSAVVMNLSPNAYAPVRQIALVQ